MWDSLTKNEVAELWPYLKPHERDEIDRLLKMDTAIWRPQPGPQMMAYFSRANELFYGGAAGGGKTDLLLGLAGTQHRQSIIFRRVFPAMRGIIERSRQIYNASHDEHAKDSYNESLHIWRLRDDRMIELGSMQYEKDKENYRGRPHDLKAWDEVTEFAESQFRFVNTWNRSTVGGQISRVVATGNPPTNPEGEWVISYWAPWLDDQHTNPAQPGALRWFARIDDKDIEVETGKPFEHKSELIRPRSRTFIPARLSDNIYLSNTEYGGVLQGLPEPLRSQLLFGLFKVNAVDNPYQTIPTAWLQAAVDRWKKMDQPEIGLTAIGVDVARGGDDKTVLAMRHGEWIAPLVKVAGKDTPTGNSVAQLVINRMTGTAIINVDVIGVGSSVVDQLPFRNVSGVNFGAGTPLMDKSRLLSFSNVRAAAYWKLREALSPDSGLNLCLPDDRELIADLAAPRWTPRGGKVFIESKDDIKKRLGRSPDCGDAVVLAWWQEPDLPGTNYLEFMKSQSKTTDSSSERTDLPAA